MMTGWRKRDYSGGKEGDDFALDIACVAQELGVSAGFAALRAVASALPALHALISVVTDAAKALEGRHGGEPAPLRTTWDKWMCALVALRNGMT